MVTTSKCTFGFSSLGFILVGPIPDLLSSNQCVKDNHDHSWERRMYTLLDSLYRCSGIITEITIEKAYFEECSELLGRVFVIPNFCCKAFILKL